MRYGLIFTVILLISPIFLPVEMGEPGRFDRSVHERIQVISDFSGAGLVNTVLRPDGAVELGRSDDYLGLDEVDLGLGRPEAYWPAVARNSKGHYIVAWMEHDLYAQRYTSSWKEMGGRIAVSSYSGTQANPAIAVGPDDRFVIAWDQGDIFMQCFDAGGNPIGSNYDVVADPGYQRDPSVAIDSQGYILLAWLDDRGPRQTFVAQRLDFGGATIGNMINICGTAGYTPFRRVFLCSNDDFIVLWTGAGQGDAGPGLVGRRYDARGRPAGEEFRISTSSLYPGQPVVAFFPDDSFVVAWRATYDSSQYPANYDVFARCFDGAGHPRTGELRVGASRFDSSEVSVSAKADRGFIVAWEDGRNSTSAIFAQRFDADGNRIGSEFQVSSNLTSQFHPTGFIDAGWDLTFLWQSASEIHIRRFTHPFCESGTVITADIAPPDLWNWTRVDAGVAGTNLTGNSCRLDFSTDGGAGWAPVAGSGSLESAGQSPALRIRATLSTLDWKASPILGNLTLQFVVDALPVVSAGPDVSVLRRTPVNLQAVASDGEGDPLSFRWTQLDGPLSLALDGSSPSLSFTSDVAGTYRFQVVVSDGLRDSLPALVNATFLKGVPTAILNVMPPVQQVGRPVSLDASNSTTPEGTLTAYDFELGDGNRSGWQAGSRFSHSYSLAGRYHPFVRVKNSEGTEARGEPVEVTIVDRLNHPPRIISVPFPYAAVGEEWSYSPEALDEDGDDLAFTLVRFPQRMSIDKSTGQLIWIPNEKQKGICEIAISVKDPYGGKDEQRFSLNVTDNIPPQLRPGCLIVHPVDGERVKGRIIVEGTAVEGTRSLLKVELRVDGLEWVNASGLGSWRCEVDTLKLANGNHTLEARAFDGSIHSEVAIVDFQVENASENLSIDYFPACGALLIVAMLLLAAIGLLGRRKFGRFFHPKG